jgi:hypothetical protein
MSKTRVTRLIKTSNNGLIDLSRPGASADYRAALADKQVVADLGMYSAQDSTFAFGVIPITVTSGAMTAGLINQDFATVTVGSTLALATPRQALRDVDTILGNANRLDQDTIFSARTVSFGLGSNNGDLDTNPSANSERPIIASLFFQVLLGQLELIRATPIRRALDSDREFTASNGGSTRASWPYYQRFDRQVLDQLLFPEDQITIRITQPVAVADIKDDAAANVSGIFPLRCYLSGVRYQRAAGV